tara:strand:- start:603 stop:1940 length:1338 start_codon:yes stop_codon:yes gene_type:complete
MARNRVIYQSEAVYATQGVYSGAGVAAANQPLQRANAAVPTGILPLNRVQSANYSFSISRQDVNQFGELASIDRIITDTPTVSFDTSYILANFCNEKMLGFEVTPSGASATTMTSCISGIIDSSSPAYQKDYFILTSKEGSDAVDLRNSGKYESLIGIGNAFVSSYSSEAAVGGLPSVSLSIEGMNMNFVNLPYSGYTTNDAALEASAGWGQGVVDGAQTLVAVTGANPAINPTDGTAVGLTTNIQSSAFVSLPVSTGNGGPAAAGQISALRPGDITLTLRKKVAGNNAITTELMNESVTNADIQGADIADAHIQSYTLSFDLSRSPIQRLGTKFAFARPIDFPITASLSIDAVLADLTTGTIADIINCDDEYDAIIKMKDPDCNVAAGTKNNVLAYLARGLKIDSESFTSSIGDNKSVSLDFSTQIGGPEQKGVGIFMSGYCEL